ncbi:MAG: ABC transporter permease [Candidatus Bathyarchaeia archaeon]|jgi:ABC-type antimicrobial peptide transport system permease subunit
MGIINRAIRNISRRKVRASLVIIALAFSMAILISIPAGVMANQEAAQSISDNLSRTINETGESINQTLTQIDCTSGVEGWGFGPSQSSGTDQSQGDMQDRPMPSGGASGFNPGQFGGGEIPGGFGGGSFGGGEANPMNQSLYDDISSINGVAAVAPILDATQGQNVTMEFMGRSFERLEEEYVIEGIPLTAELVSYNILPSNITEGRNLQAGDSGVVVLSENNTAYFNADVGDTITILDQEFTVVGIHGTSGVSDINTLYMNLTDAQTITNNTGYITTLRVFTTDSSVVSQVATDIGELHSELTVQTAQDMLERMQNMQSSQTTALENAEASLAQTQSTAIQEIIVVVLATSLIVLFVMLYTVRERTKEIGTLKAIGFSNNAVMRQFVIEGMLLSVIAGAVGIAIGIFLAPTLSSLLIPAISSGTTGIAIPTGQFSQTASVSVTPELMLIVFGFSVLLGGIGSLYPAWRAAKIRPAEAMRYE